MARTELDGSVWGRPEAVDTLGMRPGRSRRWVVAALGSLSLLAGAYIGTSPWEEFTCSSVGVTLVAGAYPAEGVPEVSVVRLYRADPDGRAVMLVPQAHVLRSVQYDDGSVALSVLIRSGPSGDDQQAAEVAGAAAAKSLTATVLYEVDPIQVLDECRGR